MEEDAKKINSYVKWVIEQKKTSKSRIIFFLKPFNVIVYIFYQFKPINKRYFNKIKKIKQLKKNILKKKHSILNSWKI